MIIITELDIFIVSRSTTNMFAEQLNENVCFDYISQDEMQLFFKKEAGYLASTKLIRSSK